MKKIQTLFFPKQNSKIFKGFGPAFLVLALGIGSGEFILWPYLSAHYGFGILWGAVLGISIQLLIIVALERHTAFLGEDVLSSFSRVFKYAFWWIVFSTIIGFGWPGFSAMAAELLVEGFSLSISQSLLSFIILVFAAGLLLSSKNAYKKILMLQKINMGILLVLVSFLFIYYFDGGILSNMFSGLLGIGDGYLFIPAGLSLVTFLGAIAYAGSGGNLLLINSFYVEREKKGLVSYKKSQELIVPENSDSSVQNTRLFTKNSWRQNTIFFWTTGLILILMLSYISYAVLNGVANLPEDFSFLIREAEIFNRDIHPFVGLAFIISGTFALFGVQLGVLDFIGRVAGNKPGIVNGSKKQNRYYFWSIITMTLFGIVVLLLGFSKPNSLIILGSTINAFSMGVIAFLLYRVESIVLPTYISSSLFKILLLFSSIFYFLFFIYVVFG